MERELIHNLFAVASAYQAGHYIELTTLARRAAGDWRFFANLGENGRTFTARKYDEVLRWFSSNWPADAIWPAHVARPEASIAEVVLS